MDIGLKGRVAIVTGGGSNIGRAISLTLGQEGATVVIADIDDSQGQKVAARINGFGGRALVIKTDVTSLASVEEMVTQTIEQYGQIDILVNNVGWDRPQLFLETRPDFWERVIALNYRSDLNCHKAVLPNMVARRYGRIVNLSSDAGRIGEYHEAVYSGCKAGVIGLSKAIAREVGRHNITVNVVCPGATRPESDEEIGKASMWSEADGIGGSLTPELIDKAVRRYPLRRLGSAQDVANTVAFLASDAASYVTGQTISVSGGYTMM